MPHCYFLHYNSLRSLRNCYVSGSFLTEGSSHRASSSLRGKQSDLLPIFSRILHYSPANLSTYAGSNFKERIPSTTAEQCLHSSYSCDVVHSSELHFTFSFPTHANATFALPNEEEEEKKSSKAFLRDHNLGP